MLFYDFNDWQLGLAIFAIVFIPSFAGLFAGHRLSPKSKSLHDSIAIVRGALLGFMALILSFGISLAVGRYEQRRAAVVAQANAIGTTYLRAELLTPAVREPSLALLRSDTSASISLARSIPDSAAYKLAAERCEQIQGELWHLAGRAISASPSTSQPRLYIQSLNEMIDGETTWTSALTNRVPTAVLALEVIGTALALGALSLDLGLSDRKLISVTVAALFLAFTLLVSFDLDRPSRGLIRVPNTALVSLRASMNQAPAARPSRQRA